MISVEFQTPEPFPVGQEVHGRVTWDPQGETRARAIDISVGWRTEGRGDRNQEVLHRIPVPLEEGLPTQVLSVPFSFRLPLEGPVTYHGHLINVIWAVTVQIDLAWAIDPVVSHPFTVVPRLL